MLAAWGQQKTDISLPVWQERSAKENLRKSCCAECRKSIFAGILVLVCLGIFAMMNACEIICVERECTRAKHEIFFLRGSISNFAMGAANKESCNMQNSPHCNVFVHKRR